MAHLDDSCLVHGRVLLRSRFHTPWPPCRVNVLLATSRITRISGSVNLAWGFGPSTTLGLGAGWVLLLFGNAPDPSGQKRVMPRPWLAQRLFRDPGLICRPCSPGPHFLRCLTFKGVWPRSDSGAALLLQDLPETSGRLRVIPRLRLGTRLIPDPRAFRRTC
ncbi:hypothetical protein EXIGLDRAFT_363752 [Exidia glandulosa HHB12029]|uniref:Uncharacterized protein n=1 Tax=Exidia glandulosa HHB12029 TaxID=1314781 RepID=A0A165C4Q1_EXIGL|nr:hypothetical protein EXIGLDRAFT_363752 [Exidia glandulosa HHB12029]